MLAELGWAGIVGLVIFLIRCLHLVSQLWLVKTLGPLVPFIPSEANYNVVVRAISRAHLNRWFVSVRFFSSFLSLGAHQSTVKWWPGQILVEVFFLCFTPFRPWWCTRSVEGVRYLYGKNESEGRVVNHSELVSFPYSVCSYLTSTRRNMPLLWNCMILCGSWQK